MGDRAVYCARLESVCAERHPGFESPPIRQRFCRRRVALLVSTLVFSSVVSGWTAEPILAGRNLVEAALREFQKGNFDKSVAILDDAEKQGIRTSQSLDIRGCALLEQGKFEEASKAFEASREADPKSYIRVRIGDAFARQKKWAEARSEYQKAIKTTDILIVNEKLRFAVFVTYLGSKDEDGARQALEQIPFPTETAAYYYAQAAWAFAHGENREGEDWLQRAQEIFKPRATAWFARHLHEFGWIKAKPPLVVD